MIFYYISNLIVLHVRRRKIMFSLRTRKRLLTLLSQHYKYVTVYCILYTVYFNFFLFFFWFLSFFINIVHFITVHTYTHIRCYLVKNEYIYMDLFVSRIHSSIHQTFSFSFFFLSLRLMTVLTELYAYV